MQPTSYQSTSDRRRFTGLALTVAAHLIVLLILLKLQPTPLPPEVETRLATFNVLPPPPLVSTTPTVKIAKKKKPNGSSAPPQQKPQKPAATAPASSFPEMLGGKELFQAADISKLPAHASGDSSGTSESKDSASAYGPGEGPGGERLFYAQWYREPTRAELVTYLPPNNGEEGWALIACKTIEDNRVENCQSLAESPVGSGLARGLRNAAWQFRIRPPRIGGKPIIGAWVRIRFDFRIGFTK